MVWNKEEGLLRAEHTVPSWQEELTLPGNSQALLEEAFDTLVYLDEKLLQLEYAFDNKELIRRVFGSLVRLYGLFWTLQSRREFRMVAQAKALWSYIHHGALSVEREHLHHMFGLTRSLEGHLMKLSQRLDTGLMYQKQDAPTSPTQYARGQQQPRRVPTLERQGLEERRRERDSQWSMGMQERLAMIEMMAVERIILERDSGEHFVPDDLLGSLSGGKASGRLPTDMSSLYTTMRELGQQMQELREQLGTQVSSVVKQSLSSMGSLYRFLKKGLRTLYSQSDEKVGLHGLIFSSREQCLLLPTSSWLDIVPCESSQFSPVGSQLFFSWSQQTQQLPVRSLDHLSERWTTTLSNDDLPAVGPSWLRDTLEMKIPEAELPFSCVERSENHENHKDSLSQEFCVIVRGTHGLYALRVNSIIGEMMIALLETPDNNNDKDDSCSPIQAVGLLPDARIVRVLNPKSLDQNIGLTPSLGTC